MSSSLEVNGIYNPSLRFAFTNITAEEFRSAWGGSPIIVKAGETVSLPHHLAVKLTNELVDKIMIGNAKMDEVAKNQPYYRSNLGGMLGVPAARKVFEDQIVRQLEVNEETPEMQVIRAQIREELIKDLSQKEGVPTEPIPTRVEEFAQIREGAPVETQPEKEPIKLKKVGRPKKVV